jgi:hypothetical protein
VQGSIETVFTEAASNGTEPHVAFAADGAAVIAFSADAAAADEIDYRRRSAAGSYNGTDNGIPVSGQSNDNRDQLQVAVDPTGEGDAVITWREDVGANNAILARRVESTEDTTIAGLVKAISNASQNADQAQVDLDGNGNAYLTWRRNNGAVNVPQERTLAPNSTLGTTENLNPAGTLNGDQPQVAVDTAGNATFAWRFGLNIETRGLTSGGALTPIQPLTSSGSNTEPRVDANASGARWGAYRLDAAPTTTEQVFGFFDPSAPSIDAPPAQVTPPAVGTPPATGTPPTTRKKCKKKKRGHSAVVAKKKCKK